MKMLFLRRPSALALMGVVTVAFLAGLGPRPRFEERWREPELSVTDLDAWLAAREAGVPGVRAGDEKGIVWADPDARGRTPLSIVYLHGFSADRHEIEPVVSELASALGANAFFTRLTGHGRASDAMAEASVEAWLDDTAEAVAIGRRLGERILLIGTSTGGTLATWAAARPEADAALLGLVLVSPNFQPKDRTSRVLLYPWGGVLARMVVGPERCFRPENADQERHWTTCYPVAALPPMMALVERVRTMDLSGVETPTLALYDLDDMVVDAAETERVLDGMTGTNVVRVHVPSSSDPARHVLAGDIVSPDSNEEVLAMMLAFAQRISP
jgi:pimeloyl-ACP methyl ester carboxylesterase